MGNRNDGRFDSTAHPIAGNSIRPDLGIRGYSHQRNRPGFCVGDFGDQRNGLRARAGTLRDGTYRSESATEEAGVFVVAEFAMALTLLIGAGLMIESFARLQRVDAGFDAENVLTFYIQPPQQKYDGHLGPALLHRVLEQVSAVPGVESATVSLSTPLMAGARSSVRLVQKPDLPPIGVGRHYVGPDHFKTLRIPLLRGRTFTPADTIGAPAVAVINQTAARKTGRMKIRLENASGF